MRPLPLLLAAIFLPATLACGDDQVSLAGGGQLRGTINDLSAEGAITMLPRVASGPIVIPRDAINMVKFAETAPEPEAHPSLVRLRNGDSLPCEVLALDSANLRIRTWYSGEHTIPRTAVAAMFLGMRPERPVFSGPDDLANWSENSGWRLEDNALVCADRGTIRRDLKLPENYILKFRLAWEGPPNIVIDFAETTGKPKGPDYYRFTLNPGGADLKRSKAGNRFTPSLYNSGPVPTLIAAGEAEFEFRVNRQAREVHVFIDGRWAKRAIDASSPELPTGTGITIQCQGNNQGQQMIKNIEVFEWDAMSQSHREEGPGAGNSDSIINSDNERFSGTLREIAGTGPKASVVLENPHFAEGRMTIPRTAVSAVYLTGPEPSLPEGKSMSLRLRSSGLLTLKDSKFADKFLVCEHPLIGAMRIDRRALDSLSITTTVASEKP